MAKDCWEVTALEATWRSEYGAYTFAVTLDGPHGSYRIEVLPECLLDYRAFQRHVLLKLGIIYRHGSCEGRAAEAADEFWRTFCQVSIMHVPPITVSGDLN